MNPNPGQQRAIHAPIDGILNVTAGAGTGKTTVLVDRYLKLMREDGVSPERILALTFTLKAAAEMRHRIHEAVRKRMPESVSQLYGAWIMNFHQFGFRIIKEHAPALGIPPDVGVMSPTEFQRIKALLERRFLDEAIEGFPIDFGGEIPKPRKVSQYFKIFFEAAKKARDDMIPVEELLAKIRPDDLPGYRAWVDAIAALSRAYEEELRRRNLIDFADMITIPARALSENPVLREEFVKRFDHILVDEFQDTSAAQNELIRTLSGGDFSRVTVVGDDKQSIYRWRDARVENIREFPGEREPLSMNYRSHQEILDLAHVFICRDPEYGKHAEMIRLEADRGPGKHPIVVFHPEEGEDAAAEAEALAVWVRCLTEGAETPGMPRLSPKERIGYDDVTILVRSMKGSFGRPEIEEAFGRHGIPYALIGGANAAETRALELLHAWLSLLLPRFDPRELIAVLEREPLCVPDAALHELFSQKFYKNPEGDWLASKELERVSDDTARERIASVRTLREEMKNVWEEKGFGEFIDWVIRESPVLLQLSADGVSARAIDDLLGEVHEIVGTLEGHDDLHLTSFLEHIRVSLEEKKLREEGDIRYPSGRVRVMTMHQSKGLEFPAVAVFGIKSPPTNKERFFLSRDEGFFFAEKDKKHWKRGYEDTDQKEQEDRMEEQEARCLLYVSMTRARDYLWLSSPEPEPSKKNLFGDILECAQAVDGVNVLRSVPALPLPVPATPESSESSREELEAALAEREARRSELEKVRAPAADIPQLITWRELLAFSRCPLQYRFASGAAAALGEYEEAPPEQGRVEDLSGVRIPAGLPPSEYGVFVHEGLRAMLETPGVEVADVVDALAQSFGYTGKRRASITDAAQKLLGVLRESEVSNAGDDVALEEPFQVRLERVVLHGIFDRIERDGEGWKVIDYKVGTPSPDHAVQVRFYAWALGRITGAPVTGVVCYLREDGVTIDPSTTPESVDAIGEVAKRLDGALVAGEFEATPGDVCGVCPWRSVCAFAATGGETQE